MTAAPKIRPCSDPRFQFVLIDSRLNPGTKAWKLMLIANNARPEQSKVKGAAA